MLHQPHQISSDDHVYRSLNSQWRELCDRYLPVAAPESMWNYSRQSTSDDPEQGWKIHVSATILNAIVVLSKVAPFLHRYGVLYKAPKTLYELQKLNSGRHYGYSQVGKCLTVYPRTTREIKTLARHLYRSTLGISGPPVPFDHRYRSEGCVYYRYGAFKQMEVEGANGEVVHCIRDPHGNLVPDDRYCVASPVWVSDPLQSRRSSISTDEAVTPLRTTFKAFRALAQRGKGGVYRAIDLSTDPPRLCILKEGRQHGEVNWDGRDGFWRVKHEGTVLNALASSHVNAPRLFSFFELSNRFFLVMECIDGESLNDLLGGKRRRLSIRETIKYGIKVANMIATIHAAGWVWRDCKPGNIIQTTDGNLRPVDFEGACRFDAPDPTPWGTRSYVPPEWNEPFRGQSRLPEDLYSLGAVIYFLVAGDVPDETHPVPLHECRRNVPERLSSLVATLLSRRPDERPQASRVAEELKRMMT